MLFDQVQVVSVGPVLGGGFIPAYWSQLPVALTCPHTEESLRDSFVPPHSLSNTIITALKQSLCPLTRLREDPSSLFKKCVSSQNLKKNWGTDYNSQRKLTRPNKSQVQQMANWRIQGSTAQIKIIIIIINHCILRGITLILNKVIIIYDLSH